MEFIDKHEERPLISYCRGGNRTNNRNRQLPTYVSLKRVVLLISSLWVAPRIDNDEIISSQVLGGKDGRIWSKCAQSSRNIRQLRVEFVLSIFYHSCKAYGKSSSTHTHMHAIYRLTSDATTTIGLIYSQTMWLSCKLVNAGPANTAILPHFLCSAVSTELSDSLCSAVVAVIELYRFVDEKLIASLPGTATALLGIAVTLDIVLGKKKKENNIKLPLSL